MEMGQKGRLEATRGFCPPWAQGTQLLQGHQAICVTQQLNVAACTRADAVMEMGSLITLETTIPQRIEARK